MFFTAKTAVLCTLTQEQLFCILHTKYNIPNFEAYQSIFGITSIAFSIYGLSISWKIP